MLKISPKLWLLRIGNYLSNKFYYLFLLLCALLLRHRIPLLIHTALAQPGLKDSVNSKLYVRVLGARKLDKRISAQVCNGLIQYIFQRILKCHSSYSRLATRQNSTGSSRVRRNTADNCQAFVEDFFWNLLMAQKRADAKELCGLWVCILNFVKLFLPAPGNRILIRSHFSNQFFKSFLRSPKSFRVAWEDSV